MVRIARALTPYSVGPFCLAHNEETMCQRVYVLLSFWLPYLERNTQGVFLKQLRNTITNLQVGV
jgi:hypothetical protein